MYIPKQFQCEDSNRLFTFMKEYSFATMISDVNEKPYATHIPFLVDQKSNLLIGHVAKANPHWKNLDGKENVLCIFNGPHSYISPEWYKNPNNVPTWNYVSIHVYGKAELVKDIDSLDDILRKTTELYEKQVGTNWSYDAASEYKHRLFDSIVGIKLNITSMHGKVKMSQNRKPEDARGAIEGLKSIGSDSVADLVNEFSNC